MIIRMDLTEIDYGYVKWGGRCIIRNRLINLHLINQFTTWLLLSRGFRYSH